MVLKSSMLHKGKKKNQSLFIMLLFVITPKLQSNPKFMTKETLAELDGVH